MIGLVVVSHSAKLAEGVVELVRGMVGDDLPLAAAATAPSTSGAAQSLT
jgi:dihydroxyacetone kinase DhaKLM complex PTS-EIIA-like component DhaM